MLPLFVYIYWLLCMFRMECLVCKHKYVKLGNYLRHLSAEHPEVDTAAIRTETKLTGKQQQHYIIDNCA